VNENTQADLMERRLRECCPRRSPVGVALAAGCTSAFAALRSAGASLSTGDDHGPWATVRRGVVGDKSRLVSLLLKEGKEARERVRGPEGGLNRAVLAGFRCSCGTTYGQLQHTCFPECVCSALMPVIAY